MGEESDRNIRIMPRTYTLSHCDFTANLTLTISNIINRDQLKGWYNKDDVLAEWTRVNGNLFLDVHCYVSGPNRFLDLAAEFRYYIFSKELPLVSSSCIMLNDNLKIYIQSKKCELPCNLALKRSAKLFLTRFKTFGVLEAVLYGDSDLFREHQELMDVLVRVFFHSSSKKYNRVECWGPLKDAARLSH
ncbi:Hypothetical predicted protein [Olea europaea subsp. europaea]|uniref:Staygreen protein domain-containing protein n=1 Tax=Olea europaea subsp. europaea TaxID=158383 RepID=A0A8S0PR82_OLEEU|nr:Hypothetical predicted protein [Olea europaea subsp. europaea]